MSGGVDSAVAALRSGPHAVAVTLELWRDPDNDAERSCCSASAVRGGARASRTAWAWRTSRLDLRDEFRAGVVRAVAGRARRRADAQPVRALQRQRAPGRHARLRRPPRRRDADHRPLRAPHARGPAAPGRRPRQGPGLHARRAVARRRSRGCASRSATSTRRRCARSPPSTSCRSPPSPTRRTCASWPAPGARRFLARHGGLGERPGDIVDAAGRVLGRHAARITSPSASAAAWRSGARASRSTCCAPTRAPTPSPSGRAPRWPRPACRVRDARLHAPAGEVDAVKLRYRAPGGALHAARRDDRARPSPSTAPPRGRPRSSCAATPCWDAPQSLRDLRRDPRAVPGLLRGARPPAPAQRVARARELRPLGPAHDRGHAAAQALLPGHREAARIRSSPPARRASAPSTSRTSARPPGT